MLFLVERDDPPDPTVIPYLAIKAGYLIVRNMNTSAGKIIIIEIIVWYSIFGSYTLREILHQKSRGILAV